MNGQIIETVTQTQVPREGKLRVSFISSLPPLKGVSSYSVPLLQALGERDDLEIEAVSFSRLYPERFYPGGTQSDPTAERPLLTGVRVHEVLDGVNPLSWVAGGCSLRGQIVHAQWWSQVLGPAYFTTLSIAKLRCRKVVITVHNVQAHEPSPWKSLVDRMVVALADHLIVHTRQNAVALVAAFPSMKGRVSIVAMGPQGVQGARGITRAAARKSLGIRSKGPVILFFGNIRPYKGLDVLLEAYASVQASLPAARLLVVGHPWKDSASVSQTLEHARRMAGVEVRPEFVPENEVEPYFAAAELVVFPYKGFEAQSGAASRALAFHRAMVVSDVGGLRELVRDPIAVVPPSQPAALAKAITRILGERGLRKRLEADTRLVARELDWPNIAAATADVYRKVLRKPGDVWTSDAPLRAG